MTTRSASAWTAATWSPNGSRRHPQGAYVWNANQLQAAPPCTGLLGLFEPDHMSYEIERQNDPSGEPAWPS